MKFVHIADMHFDCPFTQLCARENLGEVRRLEQRNVLKKVVNYIKENQIEYLFIAGDLYEHQYVKKSTIEYINSLFQDIENTQIFIAPGNHDPYIKGSFYESFKWNSNVHIATKELEVVHEPELDVYMTAFTDFYMEKSPIEHLKIQNPEKTNILISHCDLNGSKKDENGISYHSIPETTLQALKFDYAALGHIHKTNFGENQTILYPGSTISFGFDELGEHGMIVGEIGKYGCKTQFVKLDEREFVKVPLNVERLLSKEDVVEKINEMPLESQKMYEVVLVGNREFEIEARDLLKLVTPQNILKIKDETEIAYDIEEMAKENTLRGVFIRKVIEQYDKGIYTEDQIKKAIEIGLNVM